MQTAGLMEKIQNLPPETRAEVEHFVEFLTEKQAARKERDRLLAEYVEKHAGTEADLSEESKAVSDRRLSERGISRKEAAEQRTALASFAEDWDRPEMEVYDKL